ncbi:hypothetical protein M9Y10_027116 [Tritrichomonas musculus]|uniref:Protein kinase domain-containing protein n=1 Tax=Tritrichomonas musculus TaxID=1915356 RepID=A0ABR2H6Y3_9EUKA
MIFCLKSTLKSGFDSCNIDSLAFAKDSEVETFEKNCFRNAHIKRLEIPARVKNLKNDWCRYLYDLTEIEESPKNSHFILYNKDFLLGKSSESSDKFDVLHFACSDIKEAVIPPQVTRIKEYSFFNHDKLKTVRCSTNSELKCIEDYVFNFSSIESLSLPASVELIGDYCFSSISHLRSFEISPKNKFFKLLDGKYVVKESNRGSGVFDTIIFGRRDMESVSIPSHIKVINNYAFEYCNIHTVTFESNSSLELVKYDAFNYIPGPERLVLPPSLKEIRDHSFSNIKNIKSIEFLSKSVKMETDCICSCSNLSTVIFPNAEEITFDVGAMSDIPKDLKILVRQSAKLSGGGLSDYKSRISIIENTILNEENTRLKEENTRLKEENTRLKEENTRLKEENTKLKQKVTKLEEKSDKEVIKPIKLELFDTESIDALKVERTIGRGGQSEVFEVIRGQRLALKVLSFDGANKSDRSGDSGGFIQLQRFLREYEILVSLDHANIIKALGFCYGDSSHAPSILLELCVQNLSDRIGDMDDIEKVCSIYEISSAMESVHAARMIHRDLKPENVLFDESGHVKVSDFGVACIVEVEGQTQSKTSGVGTLKFMAPELLNESTKYDNKVDVYSFGVVAFFILSGGKMPKISIAEQSNGKRAPIPSSINKTSRQLINSCWSTSPSDRPSFTEILSFIKKNNFKLIDGVERNISSIKNFVKL